MKKRNNRKHFFVVVYIDTVSAAVYPLDGLQTEEKTMKRDLLLVSAIAVLWVVSFPIICYGEINELPPPDCIEGLPEAGGTCVDEPPDPGDTQPPPCLGCFHNGAMICCDDVPAEAGAVLSAIDGKPLPRLPFATLGNQQEWYNQVVSSCGELGILHYEASVYGLSE